MPKPVTAQYLLEGAVYSLEQCGHLLCDARRLYQEGSYATAVALTLFAREEFGRWQILLNLRRKVAAGTSLTVDEVRKECEDHVGKQQAGMTSLTMRAEGDTGQAKLLRKRMAASSAPASKEFQETSEQLAKIDQKLWKRTPEDRHQLRMSCLYVDPVDTADRWNRPTLETTKKRAYEVFTHAQNDYVLDKQQRYLDLTMCNAIDPDLAEALTSWPDRPTIPSPCILPVCA